MAEIQESSSWAGRNSGVSPHQIGDGMQTMDNIGCTVPGQATGRRGMRPVEVLSQGSTGSFDIIALFGLHRPDHEVIVYTDTNGGVFAGRNPV